MSRDQGWIDWCKQTAEDFRRAAAGTSGDRKRKLTDLAAHYDAQALGTNTDLAGKKPEPPKPFASQ
jgi:hypothetical protein